MQRQGGVNKVFLLGKIIDSPRFEANEIRFTLETEENITINDGVRKHFEEHRIRCTDLSDEIMLTKGGLLHIEGFIKTRSFTDEDQVKRFVTDICAKRIAILRISD